jgi:hypothetical protein
VLLARALLAHHHAAHAESVVVRRTVVEVAVDAVVAIVAGVVAVDAVTQASTQTK